jgi:hypothetical protein
MCEHRNAIKHCTALTQHDQHRLNKLRTHVRAQFRQGTATLPTAEHWRIHPDAKEAVLDESLIRTEHWLESVQLAREIWARQNDFSEGALGRQQRALQEFMEHGRIQSRPQRQRATRALQSTLDDRDTALAPPLPTSTA